MSGATAIGMHEGEVLLRLANTYDTIPLTLLEMIQNAIDADAKMVFIGIDLLKRQIISCDNGTGIDEVKFREALGSIGKSIKPRRGSLGRFGLGMISPLGKCVTMTIVSKPAGVSKANCWVFNTASISRQANNLKIPTMPMDMPTLQEPFAAYARQLAATWRTMVMLDGLTKNGAVADVNIDSLVQQIVAKLGQGMRNKGTIVHVWMRDANGKCTNRVANPSEYTGEPLPVVQYVGKEAGRVTFKLYRARRHKGQHGGQVVIMQEGDNYPIAWKEFRAQAMGGRWLEYVKEAFDVLGSGYFEGVITIEKVELAPERTKFVLCDALVDAYQQINQWYEDHGMDQYNLERESQKEERYTRLGKESLERLLHQLETSEIFSAWMHSLAGVLPLGRPASSARPSAQPPRQPAKQQVHTTSGPPRRRVRTERPEQPGGNLSLSFAYETLPMSPNLWEFDSMTGELTFNVRHPTWARLDETNGRHNSKNDQMIQWLQEYVAFKVLLLLSQNPEVDTDRVRHLIDREIDMHVALFVK